MGLYILLFGIMALAVGMGVIVLLDDKLHSKRKQV